MPAHELADDHAQSLSDVQLVPAVIPADAIDRLATAELSLLGRMQNASNATFLVRLEPPATVAADGDGDPPAAAHADEDQGYGLAIYKPERGERPLWDFRPGLHRREVAAYRLGAWAGIDVVPPTVTRADAPLGEGSVQWFVNADFSEHYFSMLEQRPDLVDQLMDIAVFDVLANNTDRKSGHCLLERATDRVWAIDNGLCFAAEFKLRTVIWDFAGDPLPDRLLDVVHDVARRGVPGDIAELLDDTEAAAVQQRAARLATAGTFPVDRSGRGYPWPLL